ncbi:hypothetical protein ACFFUB_05420 [Algimonas porphyrae]|uniref:Yip1 domain-containing protein n=1 Tax=Algimonas porphyrae TaxID=1128113 RepID=A0ABQ5V4D0_9PROT|nr:hypothetical protein [Algimonas porphyrae]GLQ21819.1 hypothetical protein GCM10007854_27740 [Algimonas porphyrae]
MRTLYGVFGAVGHWTDWHRFFALSSQGLFRSCLALTLCFPALWLVLIGLETERARLADVAVPDFRPGPFIAIIGLWLLSFPVTAWLIATLMNRAERFSHWVIVRNWALVWLCLGLGVIFLLVLYAGVPTIVGYGALLAAYLGLLPIDIRLAQRVAGFPLMTAILVGCIIVSTGMMVMLAGLLNVLQSG